MLWRAKKWFVGLDGHGGEVYSAIVAVWLLLGQFLGLFCPSTNASSVRTGSDSRNAASRSR